MKLTKIGAVSLGCSKNAVDTEIMLGELGKHGFEIVRDAKSAEIIIVNTCGFIEPAKVDSIETILEMAQYKRTGDCKYLIVTGCLSQRYPEELKQELPEVDMFWGVKDYPKFAQKLADQFGMMRLCGGADRILTTPPYRAYLRIADGCDNRCTYCAIPLIRGGRVSTPMEKVVAEARELVSSGVTELTIIAQDISAYGIDLYGKPMLRELLLELVKIERLHWIRLLYTYPNTVTKELIDTVCSEEKICNYIDMPIQHISKHMLTDMNRHGSAEHIREITDYIKQKDPDFILRTTVMLGFPGETEQDFEELMQFMQEHPFDRVGAFTYSAEDGTAAAQMPCQVPEKTAKHRLDKLMHMQQRISLESNKRRVGKTYEVLIESVNGDIAVGRSYAETADVDGIIKIKLGDFAPSVGDYVQVRITAADYYDLEGVIEQ